MLRRLFRIGLTLGIIAAIVYVITKSASSKAPAPPSNVPPLPKEDWPPLQRVDPVHDHAAPAGTVPVPDPDAPMWVEPVDGACPTGHPVKAKLSSKIFHVPGMLNYDRTTPDRCYLDAASAEHDGLRPAKR